MASRRIIYTDGARDPITRYAGCSYVYFSTIENCWRGTSRSLGRVSDPSNAELAAILAALEFGITTSGSGHLNDFAIRSDALWSVNAINDHRTGLRPWTSPAIQEIVGTIHKLEATGVRVVVEWVAAHQGCEGNEMADFAAKEAKLRCISSFHGKVSLSMPVKLWPVSEEERRRYSKPGPIEFSRECERLLLNAASERCQFPPLFYR